MTSAHLSIIDTVYTLSKIVAIIIAGIWTYINYFRGRTFKRRMEPSIAGKIVYIGGTPFISGVARVKNVGLSKLPVEQRGTAILISEMMSSAPVSDATRVNANSQAVLEVFMQHAWIEPGEPIEEAFMLQLPEKLGRVALKLELRMVTGGTEWNASSIVDFSSVRNYGPTD